MFSLWPGFSQFGFLLGSEYFCFLVLLVSVCACVCKLVNGPVSTRVVSSVSCVAGGLFLFFLGMLFSF